MYTTGTNNEMLVVNVLEQEHLLEMDISKCLVKIETLVFLYDVEQDVLDYIDLKWPILSILIATSTQPSNWVKYVEPVY